MGTVNFPRTSSESESVSEILLNISGRVHFSFHSDVYERRALQRKEADVSQCTLLNTWDTLAGCEQQNVSCN